MKKILWLESSIQKHVGSRGAAPVVGAGRRSPQPIKEKLKKKISTTIFLENISNIFASKFFFLNFKKKNSKNRLNRTQEKFHRNRTKIIFLTTFFTFFTFQIDHISKTKYWKLIFHSFQHITHLSCKFDQFWRKHLEICYWKL